MSVLFWLSITLWLVSLLSYAAIISGSEQRQREDAGKATGILFCALFGKTGQTYSRKYLYRTLVLSAIGAMVTGALYLLFGV